MKILAVSDEESPYLWDHYIPGRLKEYYARPVIVVTRAQEGLKVPVCVIVHILADILGSHVHAENGA